jgi:hypothetical protein
MSTLSSPPATERLLAPPAFLEAQAAFLRDRPELLQERRGQWVAYHGATRIAVAATRDGLWEECLRQGYQEFLVRRVWPRVEAHFISAL